MPLQSDKPSQWSDISEGTRDKLKLDWDNLPSEPVPGAQNEPAPASEKEPPAEPTPAAETAPEPAKEEPVAPAPETVKESEPEQKKPKRKITEAAGRKAAFDAAGTAGEPPKDEAASTP